MYDPEQQRQDKQVAVAFIIGVLFGILLSSMISTGIVLVFGHYIF